MPLLLWIIYIDCFVAKLLAMTWKDSREYFTMNDFCGGGVVLACKDTPCRRKGVNKFQQEDSSRVILFDRYNFYRFRVNLPAGKAGPGMTKSFIIIIVKSCKITHKLRFDTGLLFLYI